ncbi:hypothetical protein [Paenibacillus sp. CMAA1364]
MKKKRKIVNFLYMLLALVMLMYALPIISFDSGNALISIFGVLWGTFAFLVIGAHWHVILGVGEEKKRQLAQIRQTKSFEKQLNWPQEERSNNR